MKIDTIHQVWIGPKTRPSEWMDSWKNMNPNMKYELWDEKRIDNFGLKNKRHYDYYMKRGLYHGACDIARVEIIERLGGVYIDADSRCINPIEEEYFLEKDFFAVLEYEGRVANGIIGAIPGHPIMKNYVQQIHNARKIVPPSTTIGGTMLTLCIEEHGRDNQLVILPTCSFLPKTKRGKRAKLTRNKLQKYKVYAEQFWGTTKHLYK